MLPNFLFLFLLEQGLAFEAATLIVGVCAAVLVIIWQLRKANKHPTKNLFSHQDERKKSRSPISKPLAECEVHEDHAIITMPEYYDWADMEMIMDFLRIELLKQDKSDQIKFILYDCMQWKAFNSVGLELLQIQAESNWKGITVFCGANQSIKFILDMFVKHVVEMPDFNAPLFFNTLAEGLEFARGNFPASGGIGS
ncbi:MAG: hypothetical protein M3Y54_04075 [Bacteroidota bacterium]|nr:hypothetical protein [Bacteroidota bacterium]